MSFQFSSQGKLREFGKNTKNQGKVREFVTAGLELHDGIEAIAVVPFPFAVVPSYFMPHRWHSSAVMPFSLAVVCPSAVISHPRIIPDLDPLVITNTTNLFRSIDKISSNCKCLGAPPWRSKFAVVPFQTCWKCCGALLLTRPSTAIFAVPLLTSNSRPVTATQKERPVWCILCLVSKLCSLTDWL